MKIGTDGPLFPRGQFVIRTVYPVQLWKKTWLYAFDYDKDVL